MDPELKHMLSKIVQSGQTKFDTESDLLRSALHWFVYEKFKKFHSGHMDQGVRIMVSRVAKAQHAARAYDLDKYKNVNRDALNKLWAMGAHEDALGWFGEMLEESRQIHDRFGREVKLWAFSDPQLSDITRAWKKAQSEGPESGGRGKVTNIKKGKR